MSVPYEPGTVFFDSFPLLEYSRQETVPFADWPGNDTILQSPIIDTVDMLPALRAFGATGLAQGEERIFPIQYLAPQAFTTIPDPRFFLDWHLSLLHTPIGNANTDAMVVFSVFGTVGIDFHPFEIFKICCYGRTVGVQYGPHGQGNENSTYALHGSIKLTSRNVFARFHFFGNAPDGGSADFGAYLRVIG